MISGSFRRSWLRTAVAIVVVAVTFYFMGCSLYHNWGQVKGQLAVLRIRWLLLPLPFLLFAAAFGVGALAWRQILTCFGEQIKFGRATQIIAYAQFGKYLPGKVWAALGRMFLARESGIAERHTATSIIVETAYLLITALALFLVALVFYPGLLAKTWLLLILIPVTLALLYPPLFNWLVNFMLARIRQKPVAFRIRPVQMLELFGLYTITWLVQGVGLYFLTLAFYPVTMKALLILPGAFSLSWIIGFVVIFAPGGLGVREGLFALLLDPLVHGGINVVISLLSRVWITASEVLVFLFVFMFIKLKRSAPANGVSHAARVKEGG